MKLSVLNILSILGMVIMAVVIIAIVIHIRSKPSDLVERPETNEVDISSHVIIVPKNRFILIREDSVYGAVKYTSMWTTKNGEGHYGSYESYFQADGSGDFTKNDALHQIGELSDPELFGIGRLAFNFGNFDVICGSFKLQWTGGGTLYFFNSAQREGDYGIELAPTIWSDISQVNVFDKRIKWYKYDESRPRRIIPIDSLWRDSLGWR